MIMLSKVALTCATVVRSSWSVVCGKELEKQIEDMKKSQLKAGADRTAGGQV